MMLDAVVLFDAVGAGVSVVRAAHHSLVAASSIWACNLVLFQAFVVY